MPRKFVYSICFQRWSHVIWNYLTYHKNVDQIRRKQNVLALVFLSMTVAVSAGGFGGLSDKFQQKLLGIGVLLIIYLSDRLSSWRDDALGRRLEFVIWFVALKVKKYQRF